MVRSSVIREELRVRLLLLLHIEENGQMYFIDPTLGNYVMKRNQLRWFWPLVREHPARRPPWGGVSGTPNWEEAKRQTQDMVERPSTSGLA